MLKLPRPQGKGGEDGGGTGPVVVGGTYEHLGADILASIKEETIGYEGMKIDRMFFEKFEDTVRENDDHRRQPSRPGSGTASSTT